jgi:hypothetical protein
MTVLESVNVQSHLVSLVPMKIVNPQHGSSVDIERNSNLGTVCVTCADAVNRDYKGR